MQLLHIDRRKDRHVAWVMDTVVKNLRYEQAKKEHSFIVVTKNSSSVDCNEIPSLR